MFYIGLCEKDRERENTFIIPCGTLTQKFINLKTMKGVENRLKKIAYVPKNITRIVVYQLDESQKYSHSSNWNFKGYYKVDNGKIDFSRIIKPYPIDFIIEGL